MSGDIHAQGSNGPPSYQELMEYEQLHLELEQRRQVAEKAALEAKQAALVAEKRRLEAIQQFCDTSLHELLNMVKATKDGQRATAFKYAVAWVNHKPEERSADFDKIMKILDLDKLHEENPDLVKKEFDESGQGVLTVHGSYIFSMYRKLFNTRVAREKRNSYIAVQTDFQIVLSPLPPLSRAFRPTPLATGTAAAVTYLSPAHGSEEREGENNENDPEKLWCLCRQPHNNRFMICCDSCKEWFHGKCVQVTQEMGLSISTWECKGCQAQSLIK